MGPFGNRPTRRGREVLQKNKTREGATAFSTSR
jgi:hypothetical protein